MMSDTRRKKFNGCNRSDSISLQFLDRSNCTIYRHKSEFIRKGGSRDWKNHLTKEQSDRLDTLWATKMAGTAAEHWWRYEMSWEEIPVSLLSHMDLNDDDLESVSRRGSFSNFDKEHGQLSRYGSDRRCSYTSLISAGYGSVWSLNH